jgi:REP element-mobilizing transposase RayT
MRIEYNNLYTHFVFTTRGRQPVIFEHNRIRIEKYITGIVTNYSSKLYAMHANPEHLHILVSRSPSFSEEQPATNISDSSERFINENKLANGRFNWQDTASAFSVSKADVDKICSYILNQPKHNQKVNYKEEYDEFIRFYQVTLLKNKKA